MSDNPHIFDRSRLFRTSRGQGVDPAAEYAVAERELLKADWSPWLVQSLDPSLDLVAWSNLQRTHLEERLRTHGAILFRGFAKEKEGFRRFVDAFIPDIMNYKEGATPRTALGGGVYTSTEFPHDQHIHLHNELSYVRDWPMRLAFGCIVPPRIGGETPLADVRRVLERLTQNVRSDFEQRGWCLVRTYGHGLGPAWRRAFGLETLEEVAEYCLAADIQLEVLDNERIRTRQCRLAIHRHPVTGDAVWFNHVAFWHPSSLAPAVRAALELDGSDLPFNTLWGDGEPIPDAVVAELRAAIDAETIRFPWCEGDILLIDNMLVAHGREPFEGDRKILAAMGAPLSSYLERNPSCSTCS
jgi:alpha-ketoglutarate-dependent taurine dioxygenase